MKKQLLSLVAALGLLTSANAQNYYSLKSTGVDNAGGYEYKQALVAGTTASVLAPIKDDVLSTEQTLPFGWTFFGQPVTKYVASDNGFISFNTTETTNPTTPVALPSTTAPKNAIFAYWYNFKLAQSGTGVPDQVSSWTYGTAPNRVHVIQWLSITTATGSFASFAIRIYEGKSFDVVLNQVGAALAGTIGVNNADGTIGYNIAGSPSVAWSTPSADGDYANMTKYRFLPGPQPSNEVELNSLDLPKMVQKNTNVSIKGKITNWGAQNLTSFKLNYAVGTGSTLTMQLSGLDIASNGGTYDFTHNVPYSNSISGDYLVNVWVSNPNGSADGDSSNNFKSTNLTIVDRTVPRRSIHEVFTSSTCPPCNPGNVQLASVLNQRLGKFAVLKYQYYFPSTGDPYFTLEGYNRGNFYGGVNSIPNLFVDGAWNDNPNSYTADIFDQFQTLPSIVEMTSSITVVGQKADIEVKVTPSSNITSGNYKLMVAIVEKQTTKNFKTNGETEFEFVMKKMLPNDAGTLFTFPLKDVSKTVNLSYTFPGTYKLPLLARTDATAAPTGANYGGINIANENSVEEFYDLQVVAFIQNSDTKEILQSSWSAQDWALGTKENKIENTNFEMYPNPTNGNVQIKMNKVNNGSYKIYDINGKVVLSSNIISPDFQINLDGLNQGLYFIEITNNEKTTIQKLNLTR